MEVRHQEVTKHFCQSDSNNEQLHYILRYLNKVFHLLFNEHNIVFKLRFLFYYDFVIKIVLNILKLKPSL